MSDSEWQYDTFKKILDAVENIASKLQSLVTLLFFAALFYVYNYVQKQNAEKLRQANEKKTSAVDQLPPVKVFKAAEHVNDGKKHLLLAATGSVATIKVPNILMELQRKFRERVAVRVVLSGSAAEFLGGQSDEQPSLASLSRLSIVEGIYLDRDEWLVPWTRGAPILHIELRRWADLMLIAPLSANSLAKLCLGMSDNLVMSVARAWDTTGLIDGKEKKILVAPAMNTAMWEHPITKKSVRMLEEGEEWKGWMEVLRPVEKDLACGDVGGGAMREWKEIVGIVEERMQLK